MELGIFLAELLQHIDEICQAYCCWWNSSTNNNSRRVKCCATYLSQTAPSLPWHANPYRKQEILKYASNNVVTEPGYRGMRWFGGSYTTRSDKITAKQRQALEVKRVHTLKAEGPDNVQTSIHF